MAICEIYTATYSPGRGVQKLSSQIAASLPAFSKNGGQPMTSEQAIRRCQRREAIALVKVGIQLAVTLIGLFVIAYYLRMFWVAVAGI